MSGYYKKSLLDEASGGFLYSDSWFNVYENYDFGCDWDTRKDAIDVADEEVIYRIRVKLKEATK